MRGYCDPPKPVQDTPTPLRREAGSQQFIFLKVSGPGVMGIPLRGAFPRDGSLEPRPGGAPPLPAGRAHGATAKGGSVGAPIPDAPAQLLLRATALEMHVL